MTRFESFLESMVERSFARLFRARLQPVEIAKRLAREMDAGRVVGVSSVLVPNDYEVGLSEADYATFAPIRGSLEKDMAAYLQRFARDHNYATTAPPEVRIVADPALRPRQVAARGHLTEPPGTARPASAATERLDPTRMMPSVTPTKSRSAPVAAPSASYLTVDGTVYPLTNDDITIGRGLENTVVLEDRRVSRLHARLLCSGGHWTVRDEGSTNGTLVNGRLVSQHALDNGDRVSFGGLESLFEQRWEGA